MVNVYRTEAQVAKIRADLQATPPGVAVWLTDKTLKDLAEILRMATAGLANGQQHPHMTTRLIDACEGLPELVDSAIEELRQDAERDAA